MPAPEIPTAPPTLSQMLPELKTAAGPGALERAPSPMAQKTSKAAKLEASRSLYDNPERVKAYTKLNEIRRERDEVQARIDAELLRVALNKGTNRTQQLAEAIVFDLPVPDMDVHEDLRTLNDNLETFEVAEQLARRQLEETESRVNREILVVAQPDYQAIIRRQEKAVLALIEVLEEEDKFVDALEREGVSFGQRVQFVSLDSARNYHSNQIVERSKDFYDMMIEPLPEK